MPPTSIARPIRPPMVAKTIPTMRPTVQWDAPTGSAGVSGADGRSGVSSAMARAYAWAERGRHLGALLLLLLGLQQLQVLGVGERTASAAARDLAQDSSVLESPE